MSASRSLVQMLSSVPQCRTAVLQTVGASQEWSMLVVRGLLAGGYHVWIIERQEHKLIIF